MHLPLGAVASTWSRWDPSHCMKGYVTARFAGRLAQVPMRLGHTAFRSVPYVRYVSIHNGNMIQKTELSDIEAFNSFFIEPNLFIYSNCGLVFKQEIIFEEIEERRNRSESSMQFLSFISLIMFIFFSNFISSIGVI